MPWTCHVKILIGRLLNDGFGRSEIVRARGSFLGAELGFDRRKDLHRIQAPTLIVASHNDYITPPYYAEALSTAIPGAKLILMKGGGHSLTKTRPAEFNRLALDFLAG